MKKLLISTCVSMTAWFSINAQNVSIPDANFKDTLLANAAINTNGDSEIQLTEAAAYTGNILVVNQNITDLTGIEAFTSLTTLDCSYNPLTKLDVTKNIALKHLACNANILFSLDVSKNVALENLICNNNLSLASLDVSNNTALLGLYCNGNLLTSLDVSKCTKLVELNCAGTNLAALDVSNNLALVELICTQNKLTSLDVSNNKVLNLLICANNQLSTLDVKNGNNSNMVYFDASKNPDLSCIQVDDSAYSNLNWPYKDAASTYKESCVSNVSSYYLTDEKVSISPNPFANNLNIAVNKEGMTLKGHQLTIYNVMGAVVYKQTLFNNLETIDLDLPAGLYCYSIENGTDEVARGKLLREGY